MPNKSKLWSISCIFSNPPVVNVSEHELPNQKLKIRALTPRAAARRYIRGNLVNDFIKIMHDIDDALYKNQTKNPTKGEIKNYSIYAKSAIIKVIK